MISKLTAAAFLINTALLWYVADADADADALLRGDVTVRMERLLQTGSGGCIESEQSCPPSDGPKPFCTPFRSPDYCDPSESFPTLISNRYSFVKENAAALAAEGWWFPQLDDKLAGYVYLATGGYNPPQVYNHLFGDNLMNQLLLGSGVLSSSVVIRATHLHSTRGVYAFPAGVGGLELIRGFNMTLEDVKVDLMNVNATELIIEEFVEGPGGHLPTEYKFHVFKGEVGSVNVFYGRGSECGGCWAEIDENGERLDQYGSFTPGGSERKTGECNTIDFATGATRLFPVKGVDICSQVPEIEPCIFQNMIDVAKNISMEVGVYVRVDMFVDALGTIRVQEFSTNHLSGLRHCSAKLLANGCVDSCFLGRMWKALALNKTLGGSMEPIPSGLVDFLALSSDTERSLLAVNTILADPVVESGCFLIEETITIAQTTVVLNFEGEPPPPDALPPAFFDNLEARFRESFNILNSENVEFCDDLCREITSVSAVLTVPQPIMEVVDIFPVPETVPPDERRRRLDDVGTIGSGFSFNFNIGFSCFGFCPTDNPLYGNDAGRRQLQSSVSSSVSLVFPPPSDACVCPAEVTENRSPTEEEFTAELNTRLANPPTPSPSTARPTALGEPPVPEVGAGIIGFPLFTVASTVEL